MAELIKREDAIDVLKGTGIIQDNDLGHLVVEEIERIPSTTEAEIRAKAIDEFAEKLNMHFADWQLTEIDYDVRYTIDSAISAVDDIAEQLKGE